MFRLNRNEQKTNRNSLIGSKFLYFLQKIKSLSVFSVFFIFFSFFSLFRNRDYISIFQYLYTNMGLHFFFFLLLFLTHGRYMKKKEIYVPENEQYT
jgi:hypothetical protein